MARKSFETSIRIAETQGARLFAARAAKELAALQEAASGGVLLKQEPRKYLH